MENPNNNFDLQIELLKEIHANVVKWLHFAESKNGAIIAFNIAALAALSFFDLYKPFPWMIVVIAIFFCLSITVSLLSFLPQNSVDRKSKFKGENTDDTNLLFFFNIAGMDYNKYLASLEKRYPEVFNSYAKESKLIQDYAIEITDIAGIACSKYTLFRWSLRLTILSLTVSCILLLIA